MLLSSGERATLIKSRDRVDDLERHGSNPWRSTKFYALVAQLEEAALSKGV